MGGRDLASWLHDGLTLRKQRTRWPKVFRSVEGAGQPLVWALHSVLSIARTDGAAGTPAGAMRLGLPSAWGHRVLSCDPAPSSCLK